MKRVSIIIAVVSLIVAGAGVAFATVAFSSLRDLRSTLRVVEKHQQETASRLRAVQEKQAATDQSLAKMDAGLMETKADAGLLMKCVPEVQDEVVAVGISFLDKLAPNLFLSPGCSSRLLGQLPPNLGGPGE